ncbi:MAG TPA: isochorismatase family cysteine hydrolase [Longilinea sp.]|nr:isochorismatase family cysteine hydrolase [Longilinea sp.]
MKPALLVLDPQNDFFEDDNPNLAGFKASIGVINSLVAESHRQGWPVVVIQQTGPKKPAGSPAWQVYPAFQFAPTDTFMQKTKQNAFWQTPLEEFLRSKGVDSIFLAGYAAEFCILTTFRGACEREFTTWIIKGAVAAFTPKYTAFVYDICKTIPPEKMTSVLTGK